VEIKIGFDSHQLWLEERMRFRFSNGMEDRECIFKLTDTFTHVRDLLMKFLGVRQNKSSGIEKAASHGGWHFCLHLVPWPVIRLPVKPYMSRVPEMARIIPLGQIAEQPLRLQEEHGTLLSHFNFSLMKDEKKGVR
jgi:hypothetical protein